MLVKTYQILVYAVLLTLTIFRIETAPLLEILDLIQKVTLC